MIVCACQSKVLWGVQYSFHIPASVSAPRLLPAPLATIGPTSSSEIKERGRSVFTKLGLYNDAGNNVRCTLRWAAEHASVYLRINPAPKTVGNGGAHVGQLPSITHQHRPFTCVIVIVIVIVIVSTHRSTSAMLIETSWVHGAVAHPNDSAYPTR